MNKVKLGDVTDIKLGKMLDAAKNKGQLRPYLANINVRWGSFALDNLSQMPFEKSELNRFSVLPGDLMMCEGGEPGRCAVWEDPNSEIYYQKAVHRIRCTESVDPYWLYYWFLLASKNGYLDRLFTPTTIKHLVREDLASLQIDLPNRSAQDDIVNLIKPIDDKIALNKKLCAELEETAQLIYDYWFTQFDFPDENGNPYRSSGGKMVYNETLKREIPEGWKAGTIGALGTIESGATPSTRSERNWNGNIAWITPNDLSNMSEFSFIGQGERSITRTGLDSCSAVLMPRGTVVISSRAPIGYIAIASNDLCTNQGCKSIVPNEAFGTWFAYFAAKRFMPLIESQGAGTTFKEISGKTLAAIALPIPNGSLVKKFNSVVSDLMLASEKCQDETNCLTNLRDWLLPMLMNGQVKVG